MKKTLTLLLASTAIAAVVGIPAWSARHASEPAGPQPVTAPVGVGAKAMPLVLASDDDDDDDRSYRASSRRGHDNDDDDCDEDDHDCCGGASNPAPAGSVAPPQNGLFGNGAPPQVRVN